MDKKFVFLVLLLLSPALVYSTISEFEASYEILDNEVKVSYIIAFDDLTEQVIILEEDAYNIHLDGVLVEDIEIKTADKESIQIEYITKNLIDGNSFILDFIAPQDITHLNLELVVPKGYTLAEPLCKNSRSGSIYPKPSEANTDGNNMIFVWDSTEIIKGDEFPIYVKFSKQRNFGWIYMILILLILSAGITWMKLGKHKEIKTIGLKEDEEAIVNIIKKRDGKKCEQGTLRVITGIPKSSLSKLLFELESRGIIYREKRGKKNIVFLK